MVVVALLRIHVRSTVLDSVVKYASKPHAELTKHSYTLLKRGWFYSTFICTYVLLSALLDDLFSLST